MISGTKHWWRRHPPMLNVSVAPEQVIQAISGSLLAGRPAAGGVVAGRGFQNPATSMLLFF